MLLRWCVTAAICMGAFCNVHALDAKIYFIRNLDSDLAASYSFYKGAASSCMYGVYTPDWDRMPPYYSDISKLGLHYKATVLTWCTYRNGRRYQNIVISRNTPPKAIAVVRWKMPLGLDNPPYITVISDPAKMLSCAYDYFGLTSNVMVVVGHDMPHASASCEHYTFRD